jgi:NAD(P)-dependent dehydrogenase (short-subunit alcohol dehydrogenase family)
VQGLHGKRIFITGGARGIGLALAEASAAAGAVPLIADIDATEASAAAERVGRGARGYGLDVTQDAAFDQVLAHAASEAGGLDVVVNNAGIAEAAPRAAEQPRGMVERIVDVNLMGVINGTTAAIRQMELTGGHVVNIASQAGRTAVPALAAYTASKHGVVGFTDTVRYEYRGSGLRFTCVMPGPVSTGMMDGTRRVPLIRLIEPSQVADAVLEAVATGREEVFVPRSTGYLIRFASMLPVRAREAITRISGIDRVYTDIDPAIRHEYSTRVAPQAGQDAS